MICFKKERKLLEVLLLVIGISAVSPDSFAGELNVDSAKRIVPFIPTYNQVIRVDKLEHLDSKRIARLRKEYSLDWYALYCGDPTVRDNEESAVCSKKLKNLTEQETKSLIIYKTNFSKPELVDAPITEKVLEIVEDIRVNEDKGKYGNLAEFVYDKDVLLGIIFMEQNLESLAEYKWAYAEVKQIMSQGEYKRLKDNLNDRERIYKIVESDYEKERLKQLAEKYDLDVLEKRCGKVDYTDYFDSCHYDIESVGNVPECIVDLYYRTCDRNESNLYFEQYGSRSVCVCNPKIESSFKDLSIHEIQSTLITYYNGVYSDNRYLSIDNHLSWKLHENFENNPTKHKEVIARYLFRDVLLGFMINIEDKLYIPDQFKIHSLLRASNEYEIRSYNKEKNEK